MPYSQGPSLTDSPYYNLTSTACTSISTTQNYVDYTLWQPASRVAPTGTPHPSVWIPLGKLTWSWSGTAQKSSAWSLTSYSNPNNGTATLNAEFPTWSSVPTTPSDAQVCGSPSPSPSPGINIFDDNLKQNVANTAQNAVVGQEQVLRVTAAPPGETLSNCNWTVTGNIVGSYGFNGVPNGGGAVAAATSNVETTQFYWIASGSNQATSANTVTVACTDQSGTPLNASATYTVAQPTLAGPSIVYKPASAITPAPDGGTGSYIEYGDFTSSDRTLFGVNWNTYNVSNVPSNAGGANRNGADDRIAK